MCRMRLVMWEWMLSLDTGRALKSEDLKSLEFSRRLRIIHDNFI